MTRWEREKVRTALRSLGFFRLDYTQDDGSGVYSERWQHADGSQITLAWTERQS